MPQIMEDRGGELVAGQMLGRYELLIPIGKGGMGNVWAARLKGTRGFRKLVAVKTILQNLENDKLQQMLYQEAVLASQIRHPNVAETLELGEHEGTMYLVMELVLGESLLFVLREAHAQGGIPFEISVNLVAQVCRGLAAAHDLRDENGRHIGLVHRDVSPPNVLVTESGIVKIVDFGVATTASNATYGSGEIKGKLSYLAPEQLRGEPLDARVDVFATGILLYLLTVGRHPFRCSSESSTIARILSAEPAQAPSALIENYPVAVEQVVTRALDKDRAKRQPSMLVLLDELQQACPAAFGPRADEAVAHYMHDLMKERLRERSATLRITEEWAETSSRHSRSSLPAVSASAAPPQPRSSSRSALIGAGGVLLGLAMSAGAVAAYLKVPASTATPAAASAPEPPTRALTPTYRAELRLGQRGAVDGQSPPSEVPLGPPPGVRPVTRASSAPSKDEPVSRPPTSGSADAEVVAMEARAAEEAGSEAPAPAPPALPAAPPAAAAPLRPAEPASGVGPRLVASKVGHRLLLTNPSSQAARIRVPQSLRSSEQSFGATVNLCVGSTGQVTKVSILRSAGPALDPQISRALSGWRYRPLVEAGKATPFCYVLNYQLDTQ